MKRINSNNFESIANSEKGLFIIKFFSPTCGPCHTMSPVFDTLAQQNPEINFYEIDTSECPELAAHFGVRGVPFITYCENREVLYSFTGLTPLGNLQYVINNIDDDYFREHREFKKEEVKKSWAFETTVAVLILVFILAIAFL